MRMPAWGSNVQHQQLSKMCTTNNIQRTDDILAWNKYRVDPVSKALMLELHIESFKKIISWNMRMLVRMRSIFFTLYKCKKNPISFFSLWEFSGSHLYNNVYEAFVYNWESQTWKKPFLLELDLTMKNIKRTTTLWAVKVTIIPVNPTILRISCYLHLTIRGKWSLSSLTASHYHCSDTVIRALHTLSHSIPKMTLWLLLSSLFYILENRGKN